MDARNLKVGATAGLAGGLLFGAMMGAMGMLPMIGKMVGHPSAFTGLVVHLGISRTPSRHDRATYPRGPLPDSAAR